MNLIEAIIAENNKKVVKESYKASEDIDHIVGVLGRLLDEVDGPADIMSEVEELYLELTRERDGV